MTKEMEVRALEALKAALHLISAVKVEKISLESLGTSKRKQIVARLDVYGNRHTLLCRFQNRGEPRNVRSALHEFQKARAVKLDEMTPVLIAPAVSEEGRALCAEKRLSYLDLEGNVHLEFGGHFFRKRSIHADVSRQTA